MIHLPSPMIHLPSPKVAPAALGLHASRKRPCAAPLSVQPHTQPAEAARAMEAEAGEALSSLPGSTRGPPSAAPTAVVWCGGVNEVPGG
jgi:hypothetical protein